ncbi:MAG: hypothetical protein ABI824_02430 [Acidobacteriota bacterium]
MAWAHRWLPDALIQYCLTHWLNTAWPRGLQAAAEIAMLRYALVPKETFSGDLVSQFLKEPVDDSRRIRLGLTHVAAHLWKDQGARRAATRILLQLLLDCTPEIANAWTTIFYSAGQLAPDEHTAHILEALTNHPQVVKTHASSLLERLEELVQTGFSPERIGDLLVSLLNQYGSEVGDHRTSWPGCAEHLIDLALTLQRLPETREQGMIAFEKLMEVDAYRVGDTLSEIDRRAI